MRVLLSALPLLGACALYPRTAREDQQYVPTTDCVWGDCGAPTTPGGGSGGIVGGWEGAITGGSRDFDVSLDITEETAEMVTGEVTLVDGNGSVGDGAVEGGPTDDGLVLNFSLSGAVRSSGHFTFTTVNGGELSGYAIVGAMLGDITLTPVE